MGDQIEMPKGYGESKEESTEFEKININSATKSELDEFDMLNDEPVEEEKLEKLFNINEDHFIPESINPFEADPFATTLQEKRPIDPFAKIDNSTENFLKMFDPK